MQLFALFFLGTFHTLIIVCFECLFSSLCWLKYYFDTISKLFFVNIFYHSNRKLFVFDALRAGALFSFLCFAANFAQIL